ncbi:MAG TPA: LuxR C-terminal-related transcriptional regulator [Chitinophagales bacterium]|nr:LuxR C-terminal-related transcriptional regulator [Chitinophagales bacterium]
MKTTAAFLLVLIWGTLTCRAQIFAEKGMPLLQNFTPAQYQNKGKIWAIGSAPNGIVYMAADKGLVEYDGKTWKSYKGSAGFTRSVVVKSDSLIYTGSDLDFGVWNKNKFNEFEYTSLYAFGEDLKEINEEFWHTYELGDKILFVSGYNIYVYKGKQLTKIAAPHKFSGSFRLKDSLYFADEKKGLLVLSGLALTPVADFPQNTRIEPIGIYREQNKTVLVTKNSGLFTLESGKLSPILSEVSKELKTAKVFCFEQINDSLLAFGTVLKGLFISNSEGRLIHQINKLKGLPNNTILSLHYSSVGKLWLSMDYGVSYLDYSQNVTFFYDYRGDFGAGYTALLKDNLFYLGTNQGLFWANWEDLNNNSEYNRFTLVPQTEGQVWTLQNINNTLLIGHDQGLFMLNNQKQPERLSNHHGVWAIMPYKNEYLLAGSYNGISIFKKNGNSWTFWKQMELILGSCNQLMIENDNVLWVNIPNYGIIRAELNNELYPANRIILLKKDFEGNEPHLVKNNNQIQVGTDEFQYTYSHKDKQLINKTPVETHTSIVGLLPGIFQPVRLNSEVEFFPVYNGFALRFNQTPINISNQTNLAKPILRKITAFKNETMLPVFPDASIPYQYNNIEVEYVIPNKDEVLYQYRLNNSDEWSAWSARNIIGLKNLRHGKYTLFARAMVNGNITETTTLFFRIDAPWYFTWYAYLLYSLFVVLLVYLVRVRQKVMLKKQERHLLTLQQQSLHEQAEKHRQEIMLLEQERLQAEYDQIKKQLKTKTIELTNKAKENEDKNRLLLTLKEKCETAQQTPSASKKILNEMQRLLDSFISVEDKTFEIQMDELHQEFFQKLRELYPHLSNNDLRLCAYLKIGLNSKEIADILNILPSSVYISRSRLRKKLNVNSDDDLYNYLNAI